MSKDKYLRLYALLSVLIGVILLLTMYVYIDGFPNMYHGMISSRFMEIEFESNLYPVFVFNRPFVVYLITALLNIVILVVIRGTKDVEKKQLREVGYINILLSVLLIVGQVVFLSRIPDQVNGPLVSSFMFLDIPRLADDVVRLVNLNYLFSMVYIVYNLYVVLTTGTKRVEEEDIDFINIPDLEK